MTKSTDALSWASMTATVNEIKTPNSFLRNLLFSRERTFPTEQVEIGMLHGDRVMAPFVRRDGEAVMVDGLGEKFKTVSFPSIRIKRPLTASELLFDRRPGTVVFPTRRQQLSAIEEHIARDLANMMNLVENTEEWMCAQALTGVIEYSAADEAHFQVTLDKPATHTVNSAATWATATNDITVDFQTAKRLIDRSVGLATTHCLMSQEAATNFIANTAIEKKLDNRRIALGQLDLERQFAESGAMYLGRLNGIECWEYSRSVQMPDGSTVDLIGAGKVHFLSVQSQADNWMYYGAIPDMEALQGRTFQGRRFSKSWLEKDPSVYQSLIHTRPLPITRRPGFCVTMDTTP